MTHEEAAYILDPETSREALRPYLYDPEHRIKVVEEACRVAVAALRPVSREQVEKVWRGEWEFDAAEPNGKFGGIRCSKCHAAVSFGGENAFHNAKAFDSFCPFCGAPMTDEAVQMVMERLEALRDD